MNTETIHEPYPQIDELLEDIDLDVIIKHLNECIEDVKMTFDTAKGKEREEALLRIMTLMKLSNAFKDIYLEPIIQLWRAKGEL